MVKSWFNPKHVEEDLVIKFVYNKQNSNVQTLTNLVWEPRNELKLFIYFSYFPGESLSSLNYSTTDSYRVSL